MKKLYLATAALFAVAIATSACVVNNAIETACAVTAADRAALVGKVEGDDAVTLEAVNAGCTLDGQLAMAANDKQPVTPTNSGDSAGWVAKTIATLKAVYAII